MAGGILEIPQQRERKRERESKGRRGRRHSLLYGL